MMLQPDIYTYVLNFSLLGPTKYLLLKVYRMVELTINIIIGITIHSETNVSLTRKKGNGEFFVVII